MRKGKEIGRKGDREAGRQGGREAGRQLSSATDTLFANLPARSSVRSSAVGAVERDSGGFVGPSCAHRKRYTSICNTHTRATTFSFFSFGSSSGRRPWPALPVLGGTRALPWPRLCAVGPAPAVTSAWHWLLGARATLGASPLTMPLPFWLIGSAMQARVVAGPPWRRAGGPRRLLGKGARLAPPPPTGRL